MAKVKLSNNALQINTVSVPANKSSVSVQKGKDLRTTKSGKK